MTLQFPDKTLAESDIFMTGGAGTLGRAFACKRKREGWTGRLTVYSTSPWKHAQMKRDFPDVKFVQGDIRNYETLRLAMLGHDIVIHAAAVKYIPDSEWASIDTYDVNVTGSQMVCQAAWETGIKKCLGISTDKACHPANTYGATKMLMEKIFQEYARTPSGTYFQLVRYGNVLESVGSVIETWKKSIEAKQVPKITDPDMTRFWLSPSQAADHVVEALTIPAGRIYIPNELALAIGKLFEYAIGEQNTPVDRVPLRPGEKLHETLLTCDELDFAEVYPFSNPPHFILHPSTDKRMKRSFFNAYTSDTAPQLTREQLAELLNDG